MTVNPVAHFLCLHSPTITVAHLALVAEHRGSLEALLRKSDEFAAIVGTSWIGTATWEVVVYLLGWDEKRIRKEDLRIRHGLVGEKDYERWPFLMHDSPQSEIELRKARRPALPVKQVCEMHMVMIDLLLHTRLAWSVRCVLADVLDVLCYLIHLRPLEIGDNDIYLVTSAVMHAAQ